MLSGVALSDDLSRIGSAAAAFAELGEEVAAILVAEPSPGLRTYLTAFTGAAGRTWLALDEGGKPVTSRDRVREAVSIAAMCELAEENAGGGELEELRRQLVALRLTENPPGVAEAEAAALELETAIGTAPRLATPEYLDTVGAATRRLERALGDEHESPFATAMRHALPVVDDLAHEVESQYKLPLT
jgi:hypothetical protein